MPVAEVGFNIFRLVVFCLLFFGAIAILSSIVSLIARCFIFEKAGTPFWIAFIPFYKTYSLFQIAGLSKSICLFASVMEALPLLSSVFPHSNSFSPISYLSSYAQAFISSHGLSESINSDLFSSPNLYVALGSVAIIIGCALFIINLVLHILMCTNLAKRFGKSNLFAVGLFFLSFIFYPILAFGKSEYTPCETIKKEQ